MVMRAVPINPAPAEVADCPVAPSSSMGPPRALPVAKLAEPETLAESQAAGAPGAPSSGSVQRQEAEAKESMQVDNSKKRKAEGEARQSPEVATAVVGTAGKRRASPEAEAKLNMIVTTLHCGTII